MASPNAYAILTLVRPLPKTAAGRRELATVENAAEARLKRKIEQAHRVLSKLEARAAADCVRIKQLQKRKAATDARATAIEDRIIDEMRSSRVEMLAGIRCTLSTRLAPAALEVLDESQIPSDYLREKLVSAPDKIAIKCALARGEDVAGVRPAGVIPGGFFAFTPARPERAWLVRRADSVFLTKGPAERGFCE